MTCDNLLVLKHILEDTIALCGDSRFAETELRQYLREPVVDMRRVLAVINEQLADIDANERDIEPCNCEDCGS